ncbi:hypothetical protein M413DRAFT_255945 [Hebeloma cylindrosporum]|uniref:Uncharacterized protein n=1 Tax=Hebeloma cylindrosporum TaxID=76867 RepID=A0A0C3C2F4_HEBCY|nr:hypothetical protein M413DRAFT_255945 [Hebeloma cylindrosporum h7]
MQMMQHWNFSLPYLRSTATLSIPLTNMGFLRPITRLITDWAIFRATLLCQLGE